MSTTLRPHDLIWLNARDALEDVTESWVDTVWHSGLPVVVRRDVDAQGRIPVGVRGMKRDQRAAGWVKAEAVVRVCSPESLVDPLSLLRSGNVVTGEMCEELILSGADIVKVGIGPGSVCTTRVKTGVGYPQLSAVIECADAAHGLGGQIVSDGGCTMPGDVAKAFGGGADFVMLGGMLAGHEESGGKVVEENGEKFMLFYGMSSESAMTRHVGGVAQYRAAEGKTVKLPLRGPVENTARDILGGLRSACTYVGASRLKELTKRTTFIRVQEQENRVFNSL